MHGLAARIPAQSPPPRRCTPDPVPVFKFPPDESRDFLKRVIGLPGETIEVRGTEVLIDGKPLREDYSIYDASPRSSHDSFGPVTVPTGKFFVLGDNRDHSLDSRTFGLVDAHKVRGKVVQVYFSWDSERGRVRWERLGTTLR
jgi:signal peptidase I